MADRKRHRLGKMVIDEVSFVDRGMNPHADVVFWKREYTDEPPTDEELALIGKAFHLPGQASGPEDCPEGWEFDAANRRCVRKVNKQEPTKTVGGVRLPKEAFAFVEDPELPSTWKLPLFETAADARNNRPSIRRTAAAATALTGAGFRGQRVRIPNDKRAAVKAKILRAWVKARRDADQDVTRDDAPAILKAEVAKILSVTTSEDEGRTVHTHTVEFPDGVIGPGTWETSSNDGHTHRVEITNAIEPGQSSTVTTAIGGTTTETEHTHTVRINNPSGEDSEVAARHKLQADYQKGLDVLRATLGREPSEAMRKQLFDDIRAQGSREDAFNILASRIEDLSKSVFDILFTAMLEEGSNADVEGLLKTTIQQFTDATSSEIPDILSGRIIKHFAGTAAPPDPEDFQESLLEVIVKSRADLAGDKEEKGMDLSKLTPEDRAVVEKALEQAGLVEGLTKAADDAKTKIEALTKELADLKASNGDGEDDVTKGMSPEGAAAFKKMQADNSLLSKQVKEMADFSKREVLKALVTKTIDSLATGTDEIVETLWGIADDEAREKVRKLLEAASAAVKKAGAFRQLGSDAQTGATNAEQKFEALAEEICKANPKLTMVEARAQAITDNPELYDEYLAENESFGRVH